MKNKIFTLDEVLAKINDGASIMFSDLHGGCAADEIIDGMVAKKDLHENRMPHT